MQAVSTLKRARAGSSVIAVVDHTAGTVGPRDHLTDVPDFAASESSDRRWKSSTSALPHVDSVRLNAKDVRDLFGAGQVARVGHASTVGRQPTGSGRNTPI